jgi:hypothetical protein
MRVGYPVVYRITQAELDAGGAIPVSGGFVEIVDGNGAPTGAVYVTGAGGTTPVAIGTSFVSFRTAYQGIQSHRVVYDLDGVRADLADPTDIAKCLTILGVTDIAATMGSVMKITAKGEISSYPGLNSGPIYLGAGGVITQAIPTSGVLVKLGYVISSTKIIISIDRPLLFD